MSCGHWLGPRRVRTLARRTGLPIVAARRCAGYIVLSDGTALPFDFRRSRVPPAPTPAQRYGLPGTQAKGTQTTGGNS